VMGMSLSSPFFFDRHFARPASTTAIPNAEGVAELLRTERRAQGNALMSIASNIGKVVGPADPIDLRASARARPWDAVGHVSGGRRRRQPRDITAA